MQNMSRLTTDNRDFKYFINFDEICLGFVIKEKENGQTKSTSDNRSLEDTWSKNLTI